MSERYTPYCRGYGQAIDCVAYVTGTEWVSGSSDGSLALWSQLKKKPVRTGPRPAAERGMHQAAHRAKPSTPTEYDPGDTGHALLWLLVLVTQEIRLLNSGHIADARCTSCGGRTRPRRTPPALAAPAATPRPGCLPSPPAAAATSWCVDRQLSRNPHQALQRSEAKLVWAAETCGSTRPQLVASSRAVRRAWRGCCWV